MGQELANQGPSNSNDFYAQWIDQSSAKTAIPAITSADALRRLYPNHSLVMTEGYNVKLPEFPGASATPVDKSVFIENLVFSPLARSLGPPSGILLKSVKFGAFKVTWKNFHFLVYKVMYPTGTESSANQYFILHEGPEEASHSFLMASGAWTNELHEQIWVFDQGLWHQDHKLWLEIQKTDWEDIILKEEFKKALQKDVFGFFSSKSVYKELGIPWKRGLIMHGPPGNGKTMSLKTIMKASDKMGFSPIYIKSFKSRMEEEISMASVFDKARQQAPCVVVLEDLDSLINDKNRSFFFNQIDGLEGNDGLLIIGTTNHFDRLDPGLSTRPSRFDRKFYFGDPDEPERRTYAQYWQQKLVSNKEIKFPDKLAVKIARESEKFSFAYLKEAFVSSLVRLAGIEGTKPSFEIVIIAEIKSLREQLGDSLGSSVCEAQSRHETDTSAWDATLG
ncbi:hypothetical protein CVT26_010706 [Gymnopilus dilepis]|uniref:AAA+ ATPase domain-containing protein n=1 Tax=Gymnopilus dilepis TaxID=231916 RepID=A0A409VI35_9AGAR|nr:hypothetical protein CVT26_010706 [Gymnopilus dilepis]